jgi:membrane protease YdiL (CAAX protease family)
MTAVHRTVRSRRDARPALAMGVVVAWAAAGNVATNRLLPDPLYVPGAVLIALPSVAVAVRLGGCDARDLGLARADLPSGLRQGAVAAAVTAAAFAIAAALPVTRPLLADRRVDEQSVAALFYATLVRIPLGTVLLEETLFRGVFLGLGLRLWPARVAVAWSSLLFGLWHLLPAQGLAEINPTVAGALQHPAGRLLAPVAAVAGSALGGAFLCWLRLRSRSLVAPAMFHVATNSLAYATAWAVLRGR